MKNLKLILQIFILVSLLLFALSCKNDNQSAPEKNDDEIVEGVATEYVVNGVRLYAYTIDGCVYYI